MSLCSKTPRSRHICEISRIGWITPVSLLAVMIETSLVSGRIAVGELIEIDHSVTRDIEPCHFEIFTLFQVFDWRSAPRDVRSWLK